ncbi:MAG: hypothetical protein WBA62_00280 [Xanthobacteraceae bacterium]
MTAPHHLRRYVIEKAAGRTPRAEWALYEPSVGAWIRCDETTARRHGHHRRIRTEGLPWCDVLGHRTDVRDDEALQIFFLTVDPEGWPQLVAAVREHSTRCLREWTATGTRIIAAVSDVTTSAVSGTPGPLSGWPKARGTGRRSLLPR